MSVSPRPFRILIVDDNPSIHEDFRKILDPHERDSAHLAMLEELLFEEKVEEREPRTTFVVDSAHQGEQGVELVAAAALAGEPYALAFVDVRMPPGIDGIETLVRMWKHDPHLQAVICTAFSDHSWSDMTRALGHTDAFLVLRKPFDNIEVLQLAHALTQKWDLSRRVRQQIDTLEVRVRDRTSDLERANASLREEVARRSRAEEELRRMAMHDALTGLPNRVVMKERLSSAVVHARESGAMVGLCLVDLNEFKAVNDTYGHPVGDRLLQEIAQRLRGCVRDTDAVARMGGDEFVIVLEGIGEHSQIDAIARRVLDACSRPCVIEGRELVTPASIGVAVFPTDGVDPDSLLKRADVAMYEAKKAAAGKLEYYSEGMMLRSAEQLELRRGLEHAMANGELSLHYQPLVDLATGEVRGVEALLRWRHPEHGLVSPSKFIPIAERSGLIVPIGNWVLATACRQLAEWRRELGDLTMAVNVSAVQLGSPGFVEEVARVLEETRVPPECLELEISESTAMDDDGISGRVIADLARLGTPLIIDDFGAGYSSMMRLKTLPIRGLKIDRTFVKDVATDERDAAIVAAILHMAHALGLTVVAEGIERPEQLRALRALERQQQQPAFYDAGQGGLLGKPMPADVAGAMLRQAVFPQLRRAS
jgi:diguanylate cyclase (GGDEF)-like protein